MYEVSYVLFPLARAHLGDVMLVLKNASRIAPPSWRAHLTQIGADVGLGGSIGANYWHSGTTQPIEEMPPMVRIGGIIWCSYEQLCSPSRL
jgi:hypothetical protein